MDALYADKHSHVALPIKQEGLAHAQVERDALVEGEREKSQTIRDRGPRKFGDGAAGGRNAANI